AADCDERIEDGPICNRVGAVLHPFRLAVGRRDRAGVEMVAADHDRSLELALADHVVEAQPHQSALAIAEPADACRQTLEVYLLTRQPQPFRYMVGLAPALCDFSGSFPRASGFDQELLDRLPVADALQYRFIRPVNVPRV